MEEEVSESQPADTSQAANGEGIKERIIGVLRTVYDPEIPVDIYELGLVYDIEVLRQNFSKTFDLNGLG